MKKRINEIFYSLQGEGRNTGRAAVFIRFAGCNLNCPFCDTRFNDYREMSDDEIIAAIGRYASRFVVLTGGEPTLQADERLISLLHAHDYEVAMETNGTRMPPPGIDWLTVSPKQAFTGGSGRLAVSECDELKCIFDGRTPVDSYPHVTASYRYLQPCDTGDTDENRHITEACIEYIRNHPEWRLSLQTHKLIGFR